MEASKKLPTEEFGLVVVDHYNKIEDKGLSFRNLSRIVHMRNFNNWIKSVLISKYLQHTKDSSPDYSKIVALDLCCGKGGDLLKWQKGRIHHLICIDCAGTSVDNCRERFEHLSSRGRSYTAEFIVADCFKASLKSKISHPGKVDLVSCQFALHYSFESLSQVEALIKNVSELLRKGGYFISTFPDANKIMSLLESSDDKRTIGNEVFKLEFPADRPEKPPLFGDLYSFFLEGAVNCPEFLVHFPTLVRICEKYNLRLVSRISFEDLYAEAMRRRDFKDLFFKMRAFELYPPPTNAHLSSEKEEEYAHARRFMNENNVTKVKTMTKSEWEAVCLYMAVAFRKE